MSRVGKQVITIPEKTEVVASETEVTVTGPLGSLSKKIRPEVAITVADGTVTFAKRGKSKLAHKL